MATLSDYWLTFGLLLWVFAIPAAVSAYSEMRRPLWGGLLGGLGAICAVVALILQPRGYPLSDVPHAVARVLASLLV